MNIMCIESGWKELVKEGETLLLSRFQNKNDLHAK